MATRAYTEHIKIGLAAVSVLAVFVTYWLALRRKRTQENQVADEYMETKPLVRLGKWSFNAHQTFMAVLIAFTMFSTVNYARYDTDTSFVSSDGYDLMHYYLNAKYFDELGYFRLLPAMIIADNEVGEWCPRQIPVYLAQDENDYVKKSRSHALEREKEIKSYFTPERWSQFVHDSVYLLREKPFGMDCKLWRMLLQDHGFNGTPVWTLIARPIASAIPVEIIKLATWLDVLWIVAALAAVFWAFGIETFAFAWLFITVCYSFRWPHIPWAFLRYDWISSMVISICMVKKEKFAIGGAFMAYATLMRYFPGLWLFAIFGKGVHALFVRTEIPVNRIWERIPMRYYQMAFGFFLTLIVLVGASAARDGISAHKQSLLNMAAHVQPHNLSSRRQGLSVTLTYRGETDLHLITKEKKEMVAKIEKPVRIASIAIIIIFSLFLTRGKDWEVIGLGFIPYFMLTTSSYYYYIIRLTGVIIHAADLSKKRNVFGLAFLFLIEVFTNGIQHHYPDNRYLLISIMGVMLILYSLTMIGWFGYDWWKARCEERLVLENKSLAEQEQTAKKKKKK